MFQRAGRSRLAALEDLAASEGAGDVMEEGWVARGQQSALKRTLEVGAVLGCFR